MQLLGEGSREKSVSMARFAMNLIRNEGMLSLFSGISAGLMRQATYTTARLGFYNFFRDRLADSENELSLAKKALCGLGAGAIASIICCPVEVCLIRMQADGRLPPENRRNYKNIFDALLRIYREEGVKTYWRGATPTVSRAIVVNITQLATYDHAKTLYLRTPFFKDPSSVFLHFSASLTSGFIYSVCSLPLDVAKTRLQNQQPVNGQLQYRNTIQTLMLIASREGVLGLWKGFTPYFLRCGGHTITMFISLEQLKKFEKWAFDN
jgi:solute carrier family 25 oxoglutarate transporter 11